MLTASAKARCYLSATADHLREDLVAPAVVKRNLAVTWSVAVDTYVAETLIGTTENVEASEGTEVFGDCDMIVLAAYGHDGSQRWVMGNITERILLDTKLPLLIVPPQRQRMPVRNEWTEKEDMEIRK